MLQLGSAEHFMQQSKFLIYGNGKDKPPTGFMFEKEQMKGLYFNQSPTKVWYNPLLLVLQERNYSRAQTQSNITLDLERDRAKDMVLVHILHNTV